MAERLMKTKGRVRMLRLVLVVPMPPKSSASLVNRYVEMSVKARVLMEEAERALAAVPMLRGRLNGTQLGEAGRLVEEAKMLRSRP